MGKLLKDIPLANLMDLKIDYAFKQLFGNEKNKKITIVFLNAILERYNNEKIEDIKFINTDFPGEHEGDKHSRLDIAAVTNKNERINIEIQFTNEFDIVKRTIYYWSKMASTTLSNGQSYKEMGPVIAINILNFHLFNNKKESFHTSFHLYEDKTHFQLSDIMEIHFLEIPELLKEWRKGKLDPTNDLLARWLLLLGMVDRRKNRVYEDIYKELEVIAMKDDTLREAFEDWEKLSASKENQAIYEARVKEVLDAYSVKREAELREKEQYEKGMRRKALTIAKNMKQDGIEIHKISQLTGLATKEIEQL